MVIVVLYTLRQRCLQSTLTKVVMPKENRPSEVADAFFAAGGTVTACGGVVASCLLISIAPLAASMSTEVLRSTVARGAADDCDMIG